MVLHPSVQASIDRWIRLAPGTRRIESAPLANDAWETRAVDGEQVVFEEVDLDTDQPVLHALADWCDRQLLCTPRPPVKKVGVEPTTLGALRSRA